MRSDVERRTMWKIFWRLMPVITLGWAFNNLDRANISFAAIKMNKDLGLTSAQFGFAAGIYYLTYVIFCIPSNLAGIKVGLRKGLPAMMFVWGLFSMATALASNAAELCVIRLLLGAAEAGFVPGALYLIILWVPDSYRGRFLSWFWVWASVAAVIGSPLSAYILTFDTIAGLRSWQMLFVAEAAPICLVGLMGFWFLHDNPTTATWLSTEERQWLEEQYSRQNPISPPTGLPKLQEFAEPRIALFAMAYFLIMMMGISFSFFFPSYLNSRGIDLVEMGLGLSVIHLAGIFGHLAWGRWSDYLPNNRQFVCFMATLTVAVALCALAFAGGVLPIMVLGCLLQMGLAGAVTSFWPLPMGVVRASAAAGVLAAITMLGNFTGLIGPYLTGLLRDKTNSYALSFTMLASCMALAGVLALVSRLFKPENAEVRPLQVVSLAEVRRRGA